MFDRKKLKLIQMAAYVLLIVVTLLVGIGIGQSFNNPSAQAEHQSGTEDKPYLTEAEVRDFLLNYYTKKDLSENRMRYKGYMTDALYQLTVDEEDKPVNQTYKGFVVDFEFKEAAIYIDQTNLSVIARVTYSNTLLDEKKNYDTAQKNVPHEVTLRLKYLNVNGTFKVSSIESIILTDKMGDHGKLEEDKTDVSSQEDNSNNGQ